MQRKEDEKLEDSDDSDYETLRRMVVQNREDSHRDKSSGGGLDAGKFDQKWAMMVEDGDK